MPENPDTLDLIVIGGGLAEMGDVLLGPVKASLVDLVEGGVGTRPSVRVGPAALGERAGAIGAGIAASHGGMW